MPDPVTLPPSGARTLEDVIREHGWLPVPTVCALGRQLIAILQPALAAGVAMVLAPDRVTFDDLGRVGVLPAPALFRDDPGQGGGHVVEQSPYEPPVYPPQDPVAVATFGVGALLFFALTREPPFRGRTHDVIARMRQGLATDEVAKHRHDVPRVLQMVIEQAMAGDPAKRLALAAMDRILEQLGALL